MVLHTCEICKKEFNKKSNYLNHVEKRKKPSQPRVEPPQKITEHHRKITEKPENEKNNNKQTVLKPVVLPIENNVLNEEKEDEKVEEAPIKNIHQCPYCGLVVSRRDALTRHIEINCKVKKLEKQEKEAIFKLLLEKEKEKNTILESQLKDTRDQITNLTIIIKELKDDIIKQKERVTNQNINKGVINNNVTNIIIPQSRLANFGSEDVSKINYENLIKSAKKPGVHGLLSCIRDIFFNAENPEYQNVYIADNSRDKIMTYIDNDWKMNYMNITIDTIMSKLEEYIEINKDKIEEGQIKIVNDPKGEKVLSNIKKNLTKYLEKYNGTSTDSSEEQMQRFEKYMIKLLRNELCNIKDKVIENYENIKEDVEKKLLEIK